MRCFICSKKSYCLAISVSALSSFFNFFMFRSIPAVLAYVICCWLNPLAIWFHCAVQYHESFWDSALTTKLQDHNICLSSFASKLYLTTVLIIHKKNNKTTTERTDSFYAKLMWIQNFLLKFYSKPFIQDLVWRNVLDISGEINQEWQTVFIANLGLWFSP